jgi:general secretion pathway protein G
MPVMRRPIVTALVLVVAIPLLGAMTLPTIARTEILILEGALDAFRVDHGRYPTTDEGLAALVTPPAALAGSRYPAGGYLWTGRVPLDPWGRAFVYHSPSENSDRGFDLGSLGADGAPGGDGIAADIGNWPGGFAVLEGIEREDQSQFPFMVGMLAGGAVGLPVYLFGMISAALGRRSWRSALLGAPLRIAICVVLAGALIAIWFPSIG